MVSFKNEGRLGNFLFECSAALSFANLHGMEFTIPEKTHNEKWSPIYFPWLLKKSYNPALPQIVLRELNHAYNPLPFKEKYRQWNVILEGYFQSFKYIHNRQLILDAFKFPYDRIPYVGIHVRRGDYLLYPKKHILQTPEWLRECVYYFVERGYKSFVVCSDDIKWCKENLEHLKVSGAEFSYSEGNDEIADMALLSCCEHMICSSSTFGVWAAWLNQNERKKILIPDKWFGPGEKLPTKDIVPEEWIKIKI